MAQIFHRSTNTISRVSIFGTLFIVAGLLWLVAQIHRSPWITDARVAREQPIQFSHERHVGGNGIDCRYCHTSVEDSAFAGIPPTKTCMNCHARDLREQPVPRAGPHELRDQPAARVDARPRPARLRALRSQHPCQQGRGMHHVPRADRPHGADLAGEVAPDGVVPRLPPQPGAVRPPAQPGVLRRVPAALQSDRGRTSARRGVRHPETASLFDVPPMSDDRN